MTDNQAAESGTVEDPKAAALAASSSEDDRDWDADARKMGWVPEDEFKGDRKPARFKTAQEFVEDGESLTPHMKRMLAAQQKEFDDRLGRLEKVNAKTVDQMQKQHKKEIDDLTTARKKAVTDGDAAEVARLSDEIAEKKADAPEKATDADKEAEEAFVARNPWYGEDDVLTVIGEGISRRIAKAHFDKTGEQMSYADNLKKTEERVKATPEYKSRFPDDKPAANGHAAVDGGGSGAGPSRGDPFAKLNNAERAKAADDMKKFPKMYPTKQSWMEAYNS